MKLNIEALLSLYDTRQQDGGFATAMSALGGEELGICLLQHYLAKKDKNVERLPGIPKTGNRSGFRLDGWLLVDGELMQLEVKNWGANAVGGREFDSKQITGNSRAGWNQFLAWFVDPRLSKVLYPMQPLPGHSIIKHAAVCMWPVMNASGADDPWFSVSVVTLPPLGFETMFEYLHVFSMSGYLRSLEGEWLELPMPVMEERLRRLTILCQL